tara:strand:+ start:316 stop:447 length:132 start_codon:yes stop_codon:yes gene_type:complete
MELSQEQLKLRIKELIKQRNDSKVMYRNLLIKYNKIVAIIKYE